LGVVEDNADNFLESQLSVQNHDTTSLTSHSLLRQSTHFALPEYVTTLFCLFFVFEGRDGEIVCLF
jgi:hypothetical protein